MDTLKLNFTSLDNEVFTFLCIRAGEKFSQREIAHALKVSPTAASNCAKHLFAKNLIRLEKTKTINFITFNRDNHKAIELKRVENLKQIYLLGLSNVLEEQFAGSTIVLFGSYSRGEDTKTSDIDIAVIGRREKNLDLETFERVIHRKINLNFYESWKDIHRNLRNNIAGGILLTGNVDL